MKKLTACLMILVALPFMANAQEIACVEVTGRVVDSEFQQPLEGSHVFIDEQFGTVSDTDGMFSLSVPVSFYGDNLYFSYMGYETASIPVNELNGKTNEIRMVPTIIPLDEVVIVADPWKNFRDIVTDLSKIYPDKDELIAAVLRELENMDISIGTQDLNQKETL